MVLFLAWIAIGVLGCSRVSHPVLGPEPEAAAKVPVVFVPGVTGVGLSDAASGQLVWGKGSNLIRPHDRGYGMARAVTADPRAPRLQPGGVILNLRLFGFIRYRIYQQLVDLFVANGYRWGDLADPKPGDDFFLFSYDWRQDNVDSARLLARELDRLRQVRGQTLLRVNLICQSNGAHVCRYFAKYGGRDLEAVESAASEESADLKVEKLILVGASNGGSIRVLRELNRGRKYVDVMGRFWSQETLFTFSSLYQDLPAYTRDLFLDQNAEPMEVDLFDVENWQRFGWSIYGARASARLSRGDTPSWLGTATDRARFLERSLDRAHRFQKALRRDSASLGSTRYYLIANSNHETASRAVLRMGKKGWETRFGDDKEVQKDAVLRAAVLVPGDGHATAESQRWLSSQEVQRLGSNFSEAGGTHRRIILQEEVHRRILQFLAQSGPPQP